jgi:hypothetical protein
MIYPTEKIEIFVDDEWIDITSDVLDDIEASGGIQNSETLDRLAVTGILKLTLNNSKYNSHNLYGYYTPGHSNCLAGFDRNIKIKVTYGYCDVERIKFFGYIQNIKPTSGLNEPRQVCEVTAVDYMNQLTTYPIKIVSTIYNVTCDEIAETLLSYLPVQPLQKTFAKGHETFISALGSNDETKAYQELNTAIMSELGYCYLRRDGEGENLVIENKFSRTGSVNYAKSIDSSFFLESEDGTTIISEDGYYIYLDNVGQITEIDNLMNDTIIDFGKDAINYLTIKTYPKKYDETLVTLYDLTYPIQIAAGETKKNLSFNFVDPSQKAQTISGSGILLPSSSASTLKFMSNSNGTGTNLTANLIISGSINSNNIVYDSIKNNGNQTGHITTLKVKGYGVYTYESVETLIKDDGSIAKYDYLTNKLDLKLIENPSKFVSTGSALVTLKKTPRVELREIQLRANGSDEEFKLFMFLDCGDLIKVKEAQNEIDDYYFINGWSFKTKPDRTIDYSFVLTPAYNLTDAWWKIGVSHLGVDTRVAPS